MKQEQKNIISKRAKDLASRLENDEFRSSFLISYTNMFISNQLRALRADKSQSEFSELLQKPQSVISRIENPDASKSLNTLFEIANTLKLALIIRFVDYPTFIKVTSDFSEETLAPKPYQRSEIEALIQTYPRCLYCAAKKLCSLWVVGGSDIEFCIVEPTKFLEWIQSKEIRLHPLLLEFKEYISQPSPSVADKDDVGKEEKPLTAFQRYKERCRVLAQYFWSLEPNIKINEMAAKQELKNFGCEGGIFKPRTIEDWIRDLDPRKKDVLKN